MRDKMKSNFSEIEFECSGCGKYFFRKNIFQKYCSFKCKEKFGEKPYVPKNTTERTVICGQCGKTFSVPYTNTAQKYCSPECGKLAATLSTNKGRFVIFERDNFQCIYCGKTSYEDKVKLHVDHIYPRALGGEDKAYNLVTACQNCNLGKTDNPIKIYKKIIKVVSRRNAERGIPKNLIIKLDGRIRDE